ncbi:MAG: NAD(P)/FAD-dependent oxidoreductase [Candidatus Methanofastidiosia archaeon]|jgi:geranylgeranyl reductase family protein
MNIGIVGGGIAGCYTGQLLKKKGITPVIFEEHPEIGTPVQCAGLIGRETVESSYLPFPHQVILQRIDGARIFLGRDSFEIERSKAAYVIDRKALDKHFAAGLSVNTQEKVTEITCNTHTPINVTTNKKEYVFNVLLGCDGPFSVVRKEAFSFSATFYPGAQFIVDCSPEDDFVELHIKPPFFFWVIPETEETTRIGFVGPRPVHQLTRFLERNPMRGNIIDKHAGIIPIGYGSIAHKTMALIGDAACQVKPLTGGGIFYSMKAAEIAASHINDLTVYQKKWDKTFGKEIKTGLRLRKIYENMSNKNLNKIFNIFKKNKDLIETMADFERHSSLIKAFIKNPVVLKLAGSALKEFLM